MSTISTESHPCLPLALLDEFEADKTIHLQSSMIYHSSFENIRTSALKRVLDLDQPTPVSYHPLFFALVPEKSPVQAIAREFDYDARRTLLHVAVTAGDVPLAYEWVRLGFNKDSADKKGFTPLLLACRVLSVLSKAETLPADDTNLAARILRIVTMLVEQRADVNVTVDGYAPILYACEAKHWSLVEILIRNGAKLPSGNLPKLFSESDGKQLLRLMNNVKTHPSILLCPCWSGKPLADCHATRQPFPTQYACPCGSHQTHMKCCGKRNFETWEVWVPERGRIEMTNTRKLQDVLSQEDLAPIKQLQDAGLIHYRYDGFADMTAEQRAMYDRFCDVLTGALANQRDMDPAFTFALKQCDFVPRPWDTQFSQGECEDRMALWNSAIDRYIAQEKDSRSRMTIEAMSKISPDGGPLFKRCEAKDCSVIETRESAMKRCSSCQRIWYCSEACQMRHWKAHKASCKNGSHALQMLPSQQLCCTQLKRMMEKHVEMLRGCQEERKAMAKWLAARERAF